jgi:hypothetical protein
MTGQEILQLYRNTSNLFIEIKDWLDISSVEFGAPGMIAKVKLVEPKKIFHEKNRISYEVLKIIFDYTEHREHNLRHQAFDYPLDNESNTGSAIDAGLIDDRLCECVFVCKDEPLPVTLYQ